MFDSLYKKRNKHIDDEMEWMTHKNPNLFQILITTPSSCFIMMLLYKTTLPSTPSKWVVSSSSTWSESHTFSFLPSSSSFFASPLAIHRAMPWRSPELINMKKWMMGRRWMMNQRTMILIECMVMFQAPVLATEKKLPFSDSK